MRPNIHTAFPLSCSFWHKLLFSFGRASENSQPLLFVDPIYNPQLFFHLISFAEPFINDSVLDGPLPRCGDHFPTDFGFQSTRRVRRRSSNQQRTGAV